MKIKKWLSFGLGMAILIVLIILNRTVKDLPQWIIYILMSIAALLILFYCWETKKEDQKKKENEVEEEKNRKKELITFLEEKTSTSPTASVMYGILTNQILEIQTLIQKKDFEIDFDLNKEENFYEVVISSKTNKKKDCYYLSLFLNEGEEELLLDSGDEIKVGHMMESEIIDLILEDINKFE